MKGKITALKKILYILIFFLPIVSYAHLDKVQQSQLDTLKLELKSAKTDSSRCEALYQLGYYQFFVARDLANSSKNLFDALQLADKNDLQKIRARCYDALSWIEERKGDYTKAIAYTKEANRFYFNSDNIFLKFKANYNLGVMIMGSGDLNNSEIHLKKAIKIARDNDKKSWTLNALQAIGELYRSQKRYTKALKATQESAKIKFETTGTYGNGRIPASLAEIYADLGNFEKSDYWIEIAIERVEELNDKLLFKEIYFIDFELNKKQGRAVEALKSYELYTLYKDSIFNDEVLDASLDAESLYENNIQSLKEDKILAEKKLANAEHDKVVQQKLWMSIIVVLTLIALAIMIQRFIVTKKQKTLIQEQKAEVDEKNKEILDSINYAKRIQAAILPTNKLFKEKLPQSFVFYLPKAIVAGDFYWLEEKGGKTLFAAADCTGHGVPGAMVSVICNNALNRSVREHGLSDPGEILNKTREIVIQEFEKSDEDVKDGMDIALCSLENNTLKYAGAHNPLWLIRKGEVIETKANKQPIGKFDNPLPYTTHTFELEKGDRLYIFSDGYVDQFGGEKGKKFKAKAFKELLLSFQDKTMEEQKKSIKHAFKEWKGDLEQIDDVCVIGVKI